MAHFDLDPDFDPGYEFPPERKPAEPLPDHEEPRTAADVVEDVFAKFCEALAGRGERAEGYRAEIADYVNVSPTQLYDIVKRVGEMAVEWQRHREDHIESGPDELG